MQYQHDNLVVSSFLLFLDNVLMTKGKAFTNVSGRLYPMPQVFNGLYSFTSPYGQMCYDTSIPNCNVPTGVFLNGSFLGPNTSGFVSLDYHRGRCYFNTPVTGIVTANYAIKDYSTILPNIPDIGILFETKMSLRPKINQTLTGISNDEVNYPVIFVRAIASENEPFEFGGVKLTTNHIGCFVFADSQFLLDSCRSILNDSFQDYFPLLSTGEMPFNVYGGFRNNIPFNYTGLNLAGHIGSGNAIWIKSVVSTDFTKRGLFQEVSSLTNDAYFSPIDFEVCLPRLT